MANVVRQDEANRDERAVLPVRPTPVPSAVDLIRQATDVAGLCRAIVAKTARTIGKRKYVQVEGWQAIATAHGCCPSVRLVELTPGGVRAVAELRRMDDGRVLAEAEGFVGDDEALWAGRPMYARRAMASTRAMSRVCRGAFAYVVVLMDAGLMTTPAEEMPGYEAEEDGGGSPSAPQASQQAGPTRVKKDDGVEYGTLTANQLRKLGILMKELGYTQPELLRDTGKSHRRSLDREEASRLIDALQRKADEKKAAGAKAAGQPEPGATADAAE